MAILGFLIHTLGEDVQEVEAKVKKMPAERPHQLDRFRPSPLL